MKIFGYILTFLITVSIIVIIHEFGHYLAARYFNIKVKKFSIGFGKVILKQHSKLMNTELQFRILPVGGFVECDLSQNHPIWQRSLITLAGPLFSLISGMIFLCICLQIGFELQQPVIDKITPNSLAAEAKMQPDEIIQSINNRKVHHWGEFYLWLLKDLSFQGGFNIKTKSISTDSYKTYNITYKLNELLNKQDPIERLGIIPLRPKTLAEQKPHLFMFKLSLYEALSYTLSFTWFLVMMTFVIFYKLLAGIIPLSMLTGPLGIAVLSKKAYLAGFNIYLYLLGTMSIHFAALNLFPVPGLDGSQLIYDLIEKVRGQMISPPVQILLRNLTISILIILMGIVLAYDLERWVLS